MIKSTTIHDNLEQKLGHAYHSFFTRGSKPRIAAIRAQGESASRTRGDGDRRRHCLSGALREGEAEVMQKPPQRPLDGAEQASGNCPVTA